MQGPADPLDWAKRPRSATALQAIRDGARRDRRLRALYQEHVASGVCDDRGNPLQLWDGHTWQTLA